MYQFINYKSPFSMLDSIFRIEKAIELTKKNEQQYLGICDHNVMFGTYIFQEKCLKEGLIPIISCDFTIEGILPDIYGNVKVYCKSEKGYKNILALSTIANTGNKEFPFITFEDLTKHREDLVVLSGGDESELLYLFEREDDLFEETVEKYFNVFGKDYYIEFSNHDIKIEKDFLDSQRVKNVIDKYGLLPVFTQNPHYLFSTHSSSRSIAHEFKNTNDKKGANFIAGYKQRDRLTDYNNNFYYKGASEIEKLFKPWIEKYPDGLENSEKIAKECGGKRIIPSKKLPKFPLPDGFATSEDYLKHVMLKGFEERFKNGEYSKGKTREEYLQQLHYEYDVICKMGFVDYFLITKDFVQWCKDKEVHLHPEKYFPKNIYDWDKIPKEILNKDYEIYVGPGRGSAAGSLLAYCLKITETIDPIKYGLYFER